MAGVPIEAYLHWTLYDNWEWGSYEPRFGLYATERPSGARRPTDSMGEDAASTYRDAIAALRPRAQAPAA